MAWFDSTSRLPDPSSFDFNTWVSVADAFGHMAKGPSQLLSDELLARLESGQLHAAARQVSWKEASPLSRDRMSIEPEWWRCVEGGKQEHYDRLWSKGEITFYLPDLAVPGTVHVVTFSGVRFHRGEITELLTHPIKPARGLPPQPASTARSAPPPSGHRQAPAKREWISARDAAALVEPIYDHPSEARRAILVEAAAARIETRSDRLEVEIDDEEESLVSDRGPLTAKFWRVFRGNVSGQEREDWKTGTFIVRQNIDLGEQWMRAYGVEFCLQDLRSVFRLPEPSLSVFPPTIGWLQQVERVAAHPGPAEYFGARGGDETTLRDIRTEAAIAEVAQAARSTSARGPIVSNETVDAWYANLSSEDRARSVRWLHKAAQEALGPSVIRKQVEPFKKGHGPGVKPRR